MMISFGMLYLVEAAEMEDVYLDSRAKSDFAAALLLLTLQQEHTEPRSIVFQSSEAGGIYRVRNTLVDWYFGFDREYIGAQVIAH